MILTNVLVSVCLELIPVSISLPSDSAELWAFKSFTKSYTDLLMNS